ncbi:potassium-transporting ATPase subunit KdpA [soil metagenome]
MTIQGWALIALYIALTVALAWPVGRWLFALYEGRVGRLGVVERGFYAVAGIDPAKEQGWRGYALSVVMFNFAGFVLLYAILRLQAFLPLNPQGFAGMPSGLAFNSAISFVTNTNWQNYGGETTLSPLSQMVGLTVQNFLSAATGIAVAFALIRGFARREASGIGNFWADVTRITLWLLLPACIGLTLVYVALGVPQTLTTAINATTLEGAHQTIAIGPVASQLAIKMLGTNGGGYFNVNSAHPFENPSAISNFIQMLTIFAIGSGLTWTFGKAVGNTRQGWAILAAMLVLFGLGVSLLYWADAAGNPILSGHGVSAALGNMEGKEVRFGAAASALFAAVTTSASCGAVISMHDSLMPLASITPLANMQVGEVVIGGVGAGLYGMMLFAILAVFVAGLMVGRTPEYVGKKIEAREVKLAMFAVAALPLLILGLTALASVVPAGLAGPLARGPHGFSEILYAFSSAVANNGSAFAGLSGNSDFYNALLAIAMFCGRFFVILPVLAIAGSLAGKRHVPEGAGSFPTTGPLWIGLLAAIVLVVGGLTFMPALVLGPGAEQAALVAGKTF